VIEDGHARPSGLFPGAPGRSVVPLKERVPDGAVVAVTLEPAGGTSQPSGKPLFTSESA
jgi:anti-sigma-K factor RskA